eukprot:211220-Pyramimonas_sp.AAC.1
MAPIGPSDARIADYKTDSAGKHADHEPLWLPYWMLPATGSLVARRWAAPERVPQWREDSDRSSGMRRRLGLQALPPVVKVVQKMLYPETFQGHWREG